MGTILPSGTQHRRIYEHDAKNFRETGEYEDLAGLADWSYRNFSAEE